MSQWDGSWQPREHRPPKKQSFWSTMPGVSLQIVAVLIAAGSILRVVTDRAAREELERQQAASGAEASAAARFNAVKAERGAKKLNDIQEQNDQLLAAQQQAENARVRAEADAWKNHRGGLVMALPPKEGENRLSVQEQYEQASRIYESMAPQAQPQTTAPSRKESALETMDRACDSQGIGSIRYRECRTNCKAVLQSVCTGYPASMRGGEPYCVPTPLITEPKEVRCYVADNFRIVTN
jgi:hypothetical protein